MTSKYKWACLLGILALSACTHFDQAKPGSGGGGSGISEPIIVVEKPLQEKNYLPTKDISSVVDVKVIADLHDNPGSVQFQGKSTMLKEPVSGVDPRYLIEDLPFSAYHSQKAKSGVKLTPKEKAMRKKNMFNPEPVVADEKFDPAPFANLVVKMGYGTDSALPKELNFEMDKNNKRLAVLKAETKYECGDDETFKDQMKGMQMKADFVSSGADRMSFKVASGSKEVQGLKFPAQFFVADSTVEGSPNPTNLNTLEINRTGTTRIDWLTNTNDRESFVQIRAFSEDLSVRYFADVVDDGSFEIPPETWKSLKPGAAKIVLIVLRTIPQTIAISTPAGDGTQKDISGVALVSIGQVTVRDLN